MEIKFSEELCSMKIQQDVANVWIHNLSLIVNLLRVQKIGHMF